MAETVETAVYKLRVEGQAEIDRLTKSVDGLAVAEEKATASNRTFSQTLQNNVARIDPLVRAQEQYRKALETNLRYRETGVGTEAQLNAQLEASTKRYQQQVVVINQVEKATVSHTNAQKLQGYQMLNLSRQIQDVGVSLFGGQSPITVMAQQLPQIFDISQQSGVSMTNMFKQAGAAVLGFLTPMNMAIGAVAALAAGAVYAALQIDKLQVSSQRAISGAGARTGTTITDINQFVGQQSAPLGSGTGLSEKETRKLAEGLTQTGDIVIAKMHDMGNAVMGFANQTGKSVDEVIKDFVRFGTDPIKALDELQKAFGPVSQSVRDAAEAAVTAGDKTKAFNIVLDATADKAKEAAQNMGILEKAARATVNVLAMEAGKPVGLEKRLEDTRTQLNAAIEAGSSKFVLPGESAKNAQNIQALSKAFEELYAAMQKVNEARAADQMSALAEKARVATDAVIPQIEQLKNLEAQYQRLKAAQEAGVGGPNIDAAITANRNLTAATRQSQEQAERYNERVKEIAGSWGNVGQATALSLQAAQNNLPVVEAVGGAAKMAAQYTADYKNAMDAGKTSTEAAALAGANLAAAQAQVNSAAKETLWNLQNMAGVAGAVTGEQRIQAQQQATFNKLLHDGVDAEIAMAIAAQEAANAHAAATASVLRQVNAIRDSTEMIRARRNGTEAETAAAIAYKNAIESGADATAASSLYAATLSNEMEKAADEAERMAQAAWSASSAGQEAAARLKRGYDQFAPKVMPAGDITLGGGAQVSYRGGGMGRNLGLGPVNIESAMLANQAAQAQFAASMGSGLSGSGAYSLTGAYDDVIKAQQDAQKNNTAAVDKLTKSTDSLNATNQELLSPYYTQDPRTSHIGFRSQGMALGGYVDVPGGVSTNDNMIATIPVASGERIYIDPMNNRRGTSSGSGMVINISSPINIFGNADKDQFGRTVYQNNQQLAKQVRAATQ